MSFIDLIRRNGGAVSTLVVVVVLDILAVAHSGASIERQLFFANLMIQVVFVASVGYLYRIVGVASFGQAIFYGGAAYVVALASPHIHSSTQLVLLGTGAALAAAAVVGLFILRVPGLSFSILTLALGESLFVLARQEKWTGGDTGLFGFEPDRLFGLDVSTPDAFLTAMMVLLPLSLALLWWLETSRFGVILRAIRSSEPRADALGIGVSWFRYLGFVIAGTLAGLCGALYALLWNLVSPDVLQWGTSGDPIIMTLIGGMGAMVGPMIGAVTFIFLEDAVSSRTDQWQLWVGATLLVFILAAPRGVVGVAEDVISRSRRTSGERHA